MIIFYTIGCPACNILKTKLDSKHIDYLTIDDLSNPILKTVETFPKLDVDGEMMSYAAAIKWVNSQEEK